MQQLQKMVPNLNEETAKLIEKMLMAGCSKEDIVHLMGGASKSDEPLFVTPLASRPKETGPMSQGSIQKQGIKLKFGKGKAALKPELPVTKQEIPFLNTPDVSTQVTVSAAKDACKWVDMFLQQ